MKRLIKFRGYNKKNEKWLYGSYILNRGHHFVAPDEFAEGRTWEDYEVEEDSIGQLVGLTDTEGTMQRRIIMVSYQTLRRIYHQRRTHRLPEWRLFCEWITKLPFSWVITI